MEHRNRLFAATVLVVVFACTGATWMASPGKGSHASGASLVSFSDDFATTPFTTRANYLTTNQFTWNAGGYLQSPTADASIYMTTTLNTQNQYVKFTAREGGYCAIWVQVHELEKTC